jgi:hypothetical protein
MSHQFILTVLFIGSFALAFFLYLRAQLARNQNNHQSSSVYSQLEPTQTKLVVGQQKKQNVQKKMDPPKAAPQPKTNFNRRGNRQSYK